MNVLKVLHNCKYHAIFLASVLFNFLLFVIAHTKMILIVVLIVYAIVQTYYFNNWIGVYDIVRYYNGCSQEMQAALLSSVVTIVGFIVIYRTSISAIKIEADIKTKFDLSVYVNRLFIDAAQVILDLQLFAKYALEYKGCVEQDFGKAQYMLRYYVKNYEKNANGTSVLNRIASELSNSGGIIYHVMGSHALNRKMMKISNLIYDIAYKSIPLTFELDLNLPDPVRAIDGMLNKESLSEFIDSSEKCRNEILVVKDAVFSMLNYETAKKSMHTCLTTIRHYKTCYILFYRYMTNTSITEEELQTVRDMGKEMFEQ